MLLVLQFVVACILLYATAHKLLDSSGFLQAVRAFRILNDRLVAPFGWTVIFSELGVALAHITGIWLRFALLYSICMLVCFLFAMARIYRRDEPLSCHCFGGVEKISARTLFRLLVLIFAELVLLTNPAVVSWNSAMSASPSVIKALFLLVWLYSIPELVVIGRDLKTLLRKEVML